MIHPRPADLSPARPLLVGARRLPLIAVLTLGASGLVVAMAAGPAVATAPPSCGSPAVSGLDSTVTCAYTGSLQTFTVPSLVTSVAIDANGAQGGGTNLGAGADGGEEQGTLTVTPGDIFTVMTGQQGGGGVQSGTPGAGGYGGGGAGSAGAFPGAGGGGGSFVWDGSGNLTVAGGGGGGMSWEGQSGNTTCAGAGGGTTGGSASESCSGGQGGTQAAGGCGGNLSDGCVGSANGTGPAAWNAGAPTPGDGGTAGAAVSGFGNGGGGGGYYGGGGGAGGIYAAGGGGSGFASGSLAGVTSQTGANGGNGVVTFTYVTPAAPEVTSADNTTFALDAVSTFTVTTSGTPAPSLSDNSATLPSGVTFVDNGDGTATLAGTPIATGDFPFTITATNALDTDNQSFTLVVDTPPDVTSASSAAFQLGTAGTFGVTTTGFPTAAISDGAATLPPGVTFVDNSDGSATLAGTPTAAGVYPFTITASNGVSPDATQSFTLTVTTAPELTGPSRAVFALGRKGSFGFVATGTPTPTLSGSGKLPPGLSLVSGSGGHATLTGKPAAGGTFTLKITATNGIAPNAVKTVRVDVLSLSHVKPARVVRGSKHVTLRLTGTGFDAALAPKVKASSSAISVSSLKVKSRKAITIKVSVKRTAHAKSYRLVLKEGGKTVSTKLKITK